MKRPNFIIMGFPKCGSTALHYYLDAHPEIYMPKKKELHYFTQPNIANLNQGSGDAVAKEGQIKNIRSYLSLFKEVKLQKAIGETSPSYINYPASFKEIKKQLNEPKIIILLRDPVKRAYSNYLHLLREQRETETFKEALDLEDKRKQQKYSDFWYYKFNSFYYDKVSQAIANFNSVLILTQEELNKDTQKAISKTYRFLDVNAAFVPRNINNKYNKGGLYKKNIITNFVFGQGKTKSVLKKLVTLAPWMKTFKNKIISNYHYKPIPIDEELESTLIQTFKNDVIKITEMGVDTSLWNSKFFEK
ncbi:sulfotransferase [Flavobacteriaceae bacterium]|nr:sulfotransferase [Flavobacteriaceae bacterium]MDB9712095.1 sulfotransferase [Flavobacteriaceae bacterium]MDC1492202.1 sulfotransferase [Flavobacteriaceae bacterium]